MITDLRLKNFRSYADAAFEFGHAAGNRVNIIVGPNASGKTNLLEAVLVLCSGSSYRAKDIDLIAFEEPWTRLESDTVDGNRKITIERQETNVGTTSKKKAVIGGVELSRLSLQKKIPVVVFEPEHLRLLQRGPEQRRDYLDGLLEQTIASYGRTRRDYKRTLAQRNALLKTPGAHNPGQLFAWDVRLSELGGTISRHRAELIDTLNKDIQDIYQQLARSKASVQLQYDSDVEVDNYSSQALKLLAKNIDKDRLRGFTSVGPHRHDMVVLLNDHPASLSASRGESRTLILALKLLELRIVEQSRNQKPILLLDDVFSELDGARRRALTDYLKDYQTFITTTDADIVVQHFMGDCTIIPLGRAD